MTTSLMPRQTEAPFTPHASKEEWGLLRAGTVTHTYDRSTLERQGYQKFKTILSYTASLRPACTTTLPQKRQMENKQNHLPHLLPSMWASLWMVAGRTIVLGDQNQSSKKHTDLHLHSDTRTRVPLCTWAGQVSPYLHPQNQGQARLCIQGN